MCFGLKLVLDEMTFRWDITKILALDERPLDALGYNLLTGNSPRRCCHFANPWGLGPRSLYHHNISKNPSNGLTLLSLTTIVKISSTISTGMNISIKLYIKEWTYKQYNIFHWLRHDGDVLHHRNSDRYFIFSYHSDSNQAPCQQNSSNMVWRT